MNINKDTEIYGSFSAEPGNFGCEYHNRGFQKLGINAIYKSFKVTNIEDAFKAMRTLNIRGAGISMPFKVEACKWVDKDDATVRDIGATNTVTQKDGVIKAYNTDYIAVSVVLGRHKFETLTILGRGGYSRTVQRVCWQLEKEFQLITRDNWDEIQQLSNTTIFNCTPLPKDQVKPPESCKYIDCLVATETGRELAEIQARHQFQIYTGQAYPQ